MLKSKAVSCGCGRLLTEVLRASGFLVSANNPVLTATTRRVQTISEARDYLKRVVGVESTYSNEEPDRSRLQEHVVTDQSLLAPRLMNDSWQSVVIPLSDEKFREKYITNHNRVRLGILLEDVDLLAGIIAYKHCDPSVLKTGISPLSIVTAMVDEVRIHKHDIDVTSDIVMKGNVTWSGRSSLEVGMWLVQNNLPVLDAQFVMVARDAESKRAAAVHPLKPTTSLEREVFEKGNKNKATRLKEAKASLLETPPIMEEKDIVHNLFRRTLDTRSKSFSSRVLPDGCVWMGSTKLKNSIITFPEQRNIHNNIFGGFLMRQGYELAWANASVYSRSVPQCIAMDDIIFHCPVPIGSLLLMSSQINYVEGMYFTCRVHAEVMNPRTSEVRTSNELHFMFTCGTPTPPIVPRTYGESMLYLDGRRRFKNRIKCLR